MVYAIPVLALLVGVVVGINFNIVMLGNLLVLSLGAWAVASVTLGMSFMTTILAIVGTAVALQLGYFAGLIVESLGLTRDPEVAHGAPVARSRIRRILTFGRNG